MGTLLLVSSASREEFMGGAGQITALMLLSVIGGAIGSRLSRGQYWHGALVTAITVGANCAANIWLGATSVILSMFVVALAITELCKALRMKVVQMLGTFIGALVGLALVLLWISQAAG
jgi:hypothetical protein